MSSNAEIYNRNLMFSQQDIINVCKAEDEEQLRRINDVEGENTKRVLAQNLSVLFEDNLRITWFQHGSSFVLSLLGNVRSAISSKALDISHKAGELGYNASLNIQQSAQNASQSAALKAQNLSSSLASKAQGLAQDVSSSVVNKAGQVKEKSLDTAQGLAHDLKEKSLEAAHSATVLAQGKALEAKSLIADKIFGFSQRLKDAITNLSLYKRLGSLTSHSNLTYAWMEEEAERARRMTSADEVYAIGNAKKVASLIKELSPALYRPLSEPFANYSTRMLEESERSRRIADAQEDKAAVDNARSVATLINQKFSTSTQAAFFKKAEKVEQNEALKQKPYTAAM